ncbi:MAG TPA: T9SS type A sorting domain-containing protein [Saprospiraceae bacterium]|nr:T9SS type A sorting domain-containing protein [Saprospiraceae bacterium]
MIEISHGQKFDRNWLIGRNGSSSTFYDGSLLEFNETNLDVLTHKRKMSFDCDNLSMSDSLGNLIFYSNGFTIDGLDFETLQNGNDLNFCQSKGCSITGFGLINYQGIICFPFKNDHYLILHNQVKIFEKDKILAPFSLSLLQSIVEINEETKKYEVTKKNQEIIADTLGPGALVATKHANGRDWWCILKKGHSKEFITTLVTQDSVILNPIQKFDSIPDINFGFASFSPNGSKFIFQEIFGQGKDYLIIFNFDRCTGILKNPIVIKQNYTISGVYGGVAISPNSRFLYASQKPYLLQLDLDDLDSKIKFDTIAEYDGFISSFNTNFYYMQNGPDGKIYMCTLNATDALHVINNPDEKGKACNFIQHAVKLIGPNSYSLPNFPNYRLGPLIGSGCDTLSTDVSSIEEVPKISVYPNPVSSTLSIELNNKLSHEKSFKLSVYQLSGKEIYKGDIPAFAYIHNVDVSAWPAGMYYFSVTDERYRSFNGKFIVVR